MSVPVPAKRREDLCSKWFCAVTKDNQETTRYLSIPMRCKSWDCHVCRRIKTDEYAKRMEKLHQFKNLWFYTLTYFHSCSPDEAWKTYSAAWNRFRTAIAKKYGSFNYVRVLESHKKSPYPHLHIIADVDIPPTYFNKEALSAGFGYQIDKQKITSDMAFGYIRKYLQKEWTNEEARWLRKKYRCRLVSFSRGLLSPAARSSEWKALLTGTTLEVCLDHIRMDYQWRVDKRADVTYEKVADSYAEITVVWSDRPPVDLFDENDNWYPDGWVPK
jgi:hypothetical protein